MQLITTITLSGRVISCVGLIYSIWRARDIFIAEYLYFWRFSTLSPMENTTKYRYHYPGEYKYQGILYFSHYPVEVLKEVEEWLTMMTSSNGNIFRVTGHLWPPVNSPHKGQWRWALMFSVICVWINGWVNNREAGDLRRYRAHYDVTVMLEPESRHHSILFKIRSLITIQIMIHISIGRFQKYTDIHDGWTYDINN